MNAIEAADFLEHGSRHLSRVERVEVARLLREMHEALAPFVCGEVISGKIDEASIPDDAGGSIVVKMGDLRRARQAYEAKP